MQFPAVLVQTLNEYHLAEYPSFTGLPQPITARSITFFLLAILWAWLLLVSFTGWGRTTGKLIGIRSLPASVACSFGIAAVVFIGGILNLAHAIYAVVLIAIAAGGLLLYLLSYKERPEPYRWSHFWKRSPRWPKLLILLTLLILICRIAATVRLGEFRVEDDGSAYLVYPQKMLAAHSFAYDPFSDRRVISSLGGAYLLQAFVIAGTSLAHIGMADRTLGFVLMFFAIFDLGVAFGLSPPQLAAMELVAYLVPQETFNLTYTILPISLFLSIIWTLLRTSEHSETQRWRYAAIAGAVGGAILSLKSTFLPYVGAVVLLPCVFLFWKGKRLQSWMLPIIAGIGCFAVVAAWMFAMKQDSGTWLFPILGHGMDYSSYNLFPSLPRFISSRGLLRALLQGAALLVLAAIQLVSGIHSRRARLSFSVLIAAALAITAFNFESGGDYIWRYNFVQFFTPVIVFFAAQAATYRPAESSGRARSAYIVAVLSLIGCIFYYDFEGGHVAPFHQMRAEARLYRRNLHASVSDMQLVSPAVRDRYRAVEAALPQGAVALDATTNSFLLTARDGRRFFLDDWAGAASPAPGWPFTDDQSAVPSFLARNSVRYIVYGYDYANWFDMRSCLSIPNEAHFSEIDHALQVLNFVTHHQFDQLRTTHKSIYDDGKIAVIDLSSPMLPSHPVPPNWKLNTSETEMCSQIARKYMATHPSGPA